MNAIDDEQISVLEKGGVFYLSKGKNQLDKAVKEGNKFVTVKVSDSEPGGEDSFMNFSNMK